MVLEKLIIIVFDICGVILKKKVLIGIYFIKFLGLIF